MADLTAPRTPDPESPIAPPKIGEFDHLEAFVGNRGEGKSTFECSRALELSREAGGAYVIGHSLGARLPKMLPAELGGDELPITYHSSLPKLEAGLRKHPDRWHILAPPIGDTSDTADDLLAYAIRLSDAVRLAAWKRAHPWSMVPSERTKMDFLGVPCTPIIVIVDEGIAVESAAGGRSGSTPEDKRRFHAFLFSLRHLHVALLWSIQDANARSYLIMGQANVIYAFFVRHAWSLLALQAAGATQEQVEEISKLPKYKYVMIGGNRGTP